MNLPVMLSRRFDKRVGTCIKAFPELWMGKAHTMVWLLVFGVVPIFIMTALYSRVVYNLWFKCQENGQLSRQQKVCSMIYMYIHDTVRLVLDQLRSDSIRLQPRLLSLIQSKAEFENWYSSFFHNVLVRERTVY